MKNKTIALAGAGIVAVSALALGGAALARADETGTAATSAGTSTDSDTASDTSSYGQDAPDGSGSDDSDDHLNGNTDPSKPMRSDEKLLTGDTAAKVTAAARAKEPTATIERVETDSDGVYEAHLVGADGTHVTVKVDASFAVTAVQEGGPGGADSQGAREDNAGRDDNDGDGDGPHGTMGGQDQQGEQGEQGEAPASPGGTTTTTPSST